MGAGKYPSVRWADLIRPAPEDTRTPEEITADTIAKLAKYGIRPKGGAGSGADAV